MHNYTFICSLGSAYYHHLFPHTGAVRVAEAEGETQAGHSQQKDSISPSNFNAPQYTHFTLSVPTSVVFIKFSGW